MNNNKGITYSIYIYNSVEEEWDFISSNKKVSQKKMIHDSNRFADCYLFANAFLPSFAYISPVEISDEFKNYYENLSKNSCSIFVPKKTTPFICDNIVGDKKVFSTIVSEAKKRGSLTMYAYVMTQKVFNLKRKFEQSGIPVYIPEAPEEKNVWTISHFGSKDGFRLSFSPLMPPGSVEYDYKTVPKKASLMFHSSPGVVLKTNNGDAGQGVYILKKREIGTKKKLLIKLKELFRQNTFLKKNPLILETYIDTKKEKRSPFPSVECFIHQNGRIEIPYFCNMIVTPEGEFYGMEMHSSVFTKKVEREVLKITMKIANTYRDAGFRGRFDIDMINDGNKVYADESNTRTNGGTDTYLIAKKLLGKNFLSERYILSSYIDLPKKIVPSFSTIKRLFSPYLYSKKTKTGLIINSESVIKNGGFSYILVENNKKKTVQLDKMVKTLLTNK